MDRHLHVISFNIPWPANYGGVIDVYYKLKALHAAGIQIILHCFEYERPHAPELNLVCERVYYYRRRTGLAANCTLLPYNVYSRKTPELLANLLKDDYPILFEGLHSCYYLNDPRLRNRKKIFRECNIEHDYYRHLAKAETNGIKKCFFYLEALRFERYQPIVSAADCMIAVSAADAAYLRQVFPGKEILFMPCFHGNEEVTSSPGQSDFILYHGKLSVVENERAALFLIQSVFSHLPYRCIIAGMNPSARLREAASPYKNITIEANPSAERMNRLIHEAQIQTLITFQDTGLKLKLLNGLFAGRHAVVNSLMLTGSGLENLCHIADTPEEIIQACHSLMTRPFDAQAIADRKALLFPVYSDTHQAQRLKELIFES